MAVAYAPTRSLARVRLGIYPLLGGLIASSFALRALVGWLRPTPTYFPDEYIYAELGRSFAESGRPLMRGTTPHFPALLQPLLTSPAWLVGDTHLAYHLVQTLEALLMSLAAIPVYWLARRLGLGQGLSFGLAALALAIPDLLYAAWVVAEPVAYPLSLGAIAAGTAALARPSRRNQLAFVGLAALASFGRVQFAAIPVCFVIAALVIGVRERRLRAALREQALVLALFALPLVGAFALGPKRALGVYGGLFDFSVHPLGWLEWSGASAMILVYAAGWAIVPGALLGLGLSIVRPRSRVEHAFGLLTTLFCGALVLQAGFVASNGPDHLLERYVFYVVPLLAIGFGLYTARGWPLRLPYLALAAMLLAFSARLPLAGFAAAEGKVDSPFLFAVFRMEQVFGDAGTGSLIVAALAALLSVGAVVAALRPRIGTALAVSLAAGACVLSSVGASLFDLGNSRGVLAEHVAANPTWLDDAHVGPVSLVASAGGLRAPALEELFWNRSLDRIYLLPGAQPIDQFVETPLTIARDGTLLAAGRPLRGPFAVDHDAVFLRFRSAEPIRTTRVYALWQPALKAQLRLAVWGLFSDGWLASGGAVELWPSTPSQALSGRLLLRLTAPHGESARPVTVTFRASGEAPHGIRLSPGETRSVWLNVCSAGRWRASFSADHRLFEQNGLRVRFVSVHATPPVFEPDNVTCTAGSV